MGHGDPSKGPLFFGGWSFPNNKDGPERVGASEFSYYARLTADTNERPRLCDVLTHFVYLFKNANGERGRRERKCRLSVPFAQQLRGYKGGTSSDLSPGFLPLDAFELTGLFELSGPKHGRTLADEFPDWGYGKRMATDFAPFRSNPGACSRGRGCSLFQEGTCPETFSEARGYEEG